MGLDAGPSACSSPRLIKSSSVVALPSSSSSCDEPVRHSANRRRARSKLLVLKAKASRLPTFALALLHAPFALQDFQHAEQMERRVLRTSLLCVVGFAGLSLFVLRDATLAQSWQDVPSFRARLLPLVYAPTGAVVSEERGTNAAPSTPSSTPRGHPHQPPPAPPSRDHDPLDSMDAAEVPPPSFHLSEFLPPVLPLPSTSITISKPARPPPSAPRPHHLRLTTEHWPIPATLDPNERYITYLAHSGFHNQRFVPSSLCAPRRHSFLPAGSRSSMRSCWAKC